MVVLVTKDKLETVAVTVDGSDAPTVIEALKRYAWPRPKAFSLAKLFLVVGRR